MTTGLTIDAAFERLSLDAICSPISKGSHPPVDHKAKFVAANLFQSAIHSPHTIVWSSFSPPDHLYLLPLKRKLQLQFTCVKNVFPLYEKCVWPLRSNTTLSKFANIRCLLDSRWNSLGNYRRHMRACASGRKKKKNLATNRREMIFAKFWVALFTKLS